MACAFAGAPRISRIYGTGRVHEIGSAAFGELAEQFPDLPGRRAVIDVAVDRVTTSCGYAVPLMDLVSDRDRLLDWARAKGDDGLVEYRASKNARQPGRNAGDRRGNPMNARLGRRIARARDRMNELGIEVLLLSVGADLPYLTGYEAMPLERLTMFVLPASGDAHLVVPRLEAPRVTPQPDLFDIVPWEETDDPIRLVAKLVGPATRSAADRRQHVGSLRPRSAARAGRTPRSRAPTRIMAPIRMVKDAARDRRAARGRRRGRRDRGRDARAAVRRPDRARPAPRARRAHARSTAIERSNFAIVAAGEHAASPHHEPTAERSDRRRRHRAVRLRRHDARLLLRHHTHVPRGRAVRPRCRDAYAVLVEAQEAGVRAGDRRHAVRATSTRRPGASSTAAGLGEHFVHRVGHGIGQEAHEDPYMVVGQRPRRSRPATRSASSPASTSTGRFGMRLEDIVVATDDGPLRLNDTPRDLAPVG